MAVISRAHAVVEFMRGRVGVDARRRDAPASAARPRCAIGGVAETVFLLNIRDRLDVISAMPIGDTAAAPVAASC